jgi:hypothetical protein
MYAQAYLDISSSLTVVAVFAAAISFGTLVTLPLGLPNAQYISKLLSIASYIFTACLFASVGISYLLRHDERDKPLSPAKRTLCQIHVWIVIVLLVGGFVVINVVMINFGQKPVGIAGIVSIAGAVPMWFLGLKYLEDHGYLEHPPPSTTIETVESSNVPASYREDPLIQGYQGEWAQRMKPNKC